METPVTGYLEGATIERVAGILLAGGIAVLPTDTIYGLHCLTAREGAVEEIRALKARTEGGFILLASDLAMADIYVGDWPGNSRAFLSEAWPAPLTAILPASDAAPMIIVTGGTIALRVPALHTLRDVIRMAGGPIVSTSVNRTGEKPMEKINDIRLVFPGLGAYIARRGKSHALPSTLVDFTSATPRLVRAGRYRWNGSPHTNEGAP